MLKTQESNMKEIMYRGLIDELTDNRIRLDEFYIDDYFAQFVGKHVEIIIRELESEEYANMIENEEDYNAGIKSGSKLGHKAEKDRMKEIIKQELKKKTYGPTTRDGVLKMLLKKI